MMASLESIQEKAGAWDKINSAFREDIDWEHVEYIAIKEAGKETRLVRFG